MKKVQVKDSEEPVTVADFRRRVRRLATAYRRAGLPLDRNDRLIKEVEVFNGASPIKSDPIIRAAFQGVRPKPKQCFYNAQTFVLYDETDYAIYYEGYVTSGVQGMLIHHAWLVVEGVVFDPTLEAAERAAKRSGLSFLGKESRRYFGISFTQMQVAMSLGGGMAGPLLDSVPSVI